MNPLPRALMTAGLVVGLGQALTARPATAQEPGLGRILGGYGAMSGAAGSSMGRGNVIVPAGGRSEVTMSPAMSGAGLSFRPRTSAVMDSARPSFVLDSMGGGMTRMAGGMGGRRPFALPSGPLLGGMGLGGGMRQMPATGMGVMPPSIGYPFRQPPSLLGPASGSGMSM